MIISLIKALIQKEIKKKKKKTQTAHYFDL